MKYFEIHKGLTGLNNANEDVQQIEFVVENLGVYSRAFGVPDRFALSLVLRLS